MLEVERRLSLNAAADEVWDLIGDFLDLGWHPAAKATNPDDRGGIVHRVIVLPDDAEILERLEDMDDAGRSYSYSIVESPLPVTDYRSTLKVYDLGEEGTEVLWRSDFRAAGIDDEEARKIVAGIYEAGFSALAERFG